MGKAEAKIEDYLKDEVEKLGGIAYKFVSPARRSVPDRLCVFETGLVAFVECKAPGGGLTKGQEREIERLASLSQPVFVVQSKEEVDEVIALIVSLILRRQAQAKSLASPSPLVDVKGKELKI